jgi:hypothetical protein
MINYLDFSRTVELSSVEVFFDPFSAYTERMSPIELRVSIFSNFEG